MGSKVEEALEKLRSTSHDLILVRSLSKGQKKRIADAIQALVIVQRSAKRKKYAVFLRLVLSDYGPAAVLVCVLSLGQARIVDITNSERIKLRKSIQRITVISHQTILALATASQIPSSIDTILSTPLGAQVSGGHRENQLLGVLEYVETTATGTDINLTAGLKVHSSGLESLSTRDQRVISNVPIRGTQRVFGDYICRAVRRTYVDNELRASVSIILPQWGGVDCFISLDICEEEAESLAMSLFNARVQRVGSKWKVVLRDGLTIIASGSEVTIKGVMDEVIQKQFGPEIYKAINESRVRQTERDQGMELTTCVSMILTESGAIISLALGLKGGLQIKDKLEA